MSNYKAIVFDLTGTILPRRKELDTIIQSSLILNVSRIFGVPINQFAKKFWEEYHTTKSASKTLYKLLRIPLSDAEFLVKISLHEIYHLSKLERQKQLIDFFEKLSSKYKLAVFSKIWRKTGEMILEQLGILEYFDFLLFGDMMPSQIENALLIIKNHYRDIRGEEILVVGDNPDKDYFTPRKLGMHSLLVKSPHVPPNLIKEKEIEFIPDLLHLSGWLREKEERKTLIQ